MKQLEHELQLLRERISKMGDLTETMVAEAILALDDPLDNNHYQRVQAEESRLDQMQLDVDKEAIRLLTVYGPVAGNLRFLLAATRINAELERIGDQTVSMCNHIQLMVSQGDVTPMPQFRAMAKLVRAMLHDTLKAFRLDDNRKAKSTMASDELVDVLNDEIVREMLGGDRSNGSGPQDIASAVAQIMISQSLERIGDQACNVCEQIVYMVEGADIRHQA